MFNLAKDAKQQVYRAEGVQAVTVVNWMIGTNKPLEVPIGDLV